MIMSTATFMVMIVMMMLMLFVIMVMSTSAFMVMVVMMLMFLVIVIMSTSAFMVMMMLMFFMIVMVMFAMFMYMSAFRAYFLFFHQFLRKGYWMFHNIKKFLSVQFFNRCRDNCSFCIDLTEKFQRSLCFCFIYDISTAHNDCSGIFYLIIKELTKVSHIHFAFLCIDNSCIAVQYKSCLFFNTLYSLDNIR